MTAIADRGYRHPDRLVSTDWVAAHTSDPKVRIIESNEDTLLYATGHVPGAVHVDWTSDLNDQLRRDYIEREGFEALTIKEGKPEQAIPKIVEGRLNSWYAERVLPEQGLFGDKQTVQERLGDATIVRFVQAYIGG